MGGLARELIEVIGKALCVARLQVLSDWATIFSAAHAKYAHHRIIPPQTRRWSGPSAVTTSSHLYLQGRDSCPLCARKFIPDRYVYQGSAPFAVKLKSPVPLPCP
ncbi:hypothetical protein LCGC14_1257030 [marine sediment metagenome]|uniref:Uncharacterized protein n=1 Tax=marine sediment metagenome TaxID=412755 RepID=A0A0F9LN41_9ZZZZ